MSRLAKYSKANMLGIALLVPLVCQAQEVPKVVQDWLPLHVGDRWIYECKVLDGNKMHPRVGVWQQAEIVTVIGATAFCLNAGRALSRRLLSVSRKGRAVG